MKTRHILVGAVVLVALVLGGFWLFLRQVPPRDTLSGFQEACLAGQRVGVSGANRPLDDETEARLQAFCGCVEQEVGNRLSQQDIAAIGLQQSGKDVDAKLAAILNLCRARNP